MQPPQDELDRRLSRALRAAVERVQPDPQAEQHVIDGLKDEPPGVTPLAPRQRRSVTTLTAGLVAAAALVAFAFLARPVARNLPVVGDDDPAPTATVAPTLTPPSVAPSPAPVQVVKPRPTVRRTPRPAPQAPAPSATPKATPAPSATVVPSPSATPGGSPGPSASPSPSAPASPSPKP